MKFLDRVLLSRAEEQSRAATYKVKCVGCGKCQLDADETNGLCYKCRWARDPDAKRKGSCPQDVQSEEAAPD